MSVHVAYIFPNILPQDGLVFPLAQLFSQLLFLRPVEDDLPEADTPLLQAFTNQQDENRLLAFTCPGSVVPDDESEYSIVNTLLHQTGIQTGSGKHTSEPANRQEKNASSVLLWQARLLLKLGESVDKQQADIRTNLAR
ncbi:MAG: hypothetical protein D3920_15150, partial [Candidatus Electrothrix sp. AW2]|nr:hypothetical protein [Candidatus Electrothrix gigas]